MSEIDSEKLTTESKPWAGNEIKPFTKERLYNAIKKSSPFGQYCIDMIEKEEKEKNENSNT